MSNTKRAEQGMLYVVATPIGNLSDMSPRAVETLSRVDLIAAENTRHSAPLLRHFGITTPVTAFHEHNERRRCPQLVRRLEAGDAIALISDAGTPLISDPGYRLVAAARDAGVPVTPVPLPRPIHNQGGRARFGRRAPDHTLARQAANDTS